MFCACVCTHICCDDISAVWNHNRGVRRWNILTYRPGGTLPGWQAVQWKLRYCVCCNMCPLPRPPLSPSASQHLIFQPSPDASLPPAALHWVRTDALGEETNKHDHRAVQFDCQHFLSSAFEVHSDRFDVQLLRSPCSVRIRWTQSTFPSEIWED